MRTVFKNLVVAVITLEARAVLRKYKPKIVAITGSVGNTSTKDAIYAALAQGGRHPQLGSLAAGGYRGHHAPAGDTGACRVF